MKQELYLFLESKGFTPEDIKTVDKYIDQEKDEEYTVGYSIDQIQELNPFFSLPESIKLLDLLIQDDYCWDSCSETLNELWQEADPPELFIIECARLFAKVLGEELFNMINQYKDGDFLSEFCLEYKCNNSFIDNLYNYSTYYDEDTLLHRLSRSIDKFTKQNYLSQEYSLFCLLENTILSYTPTTQEMLTNLVCQITNYFHELNSIEILQLTNLLNARLPN
jgi:hypothetical protein